MKKLSFAVLAAALFFTACSKDDDKPTTPATGGSFSFNDTTVVANNGYLFVYGVSDFSVVFTDVVLSDTLKGKVSAVGFDLDTLISGQTYTYLSNDSVAYNKSKNFPDAYAYYKSDWVDGDIDGTTGRILDGITSGTVTYTKNGDTYSITYSFVFPTGKLTGKYDGKLELRNQQ
ncbi:hypothetical protein SAMN05428988_5810 [Chitinophaga sp. YR573]|uniref:hypothetical protein n=1 Tax=Chitinophaga sp. YR573 TaxID=1881040 RepID=UPI0008AB8B09|nr:hypothetical protein [Chitinophaga sp. YR573]SEW44604.1 hypothetical protein SAMN05428988_5810 [Chitinophaga sp. YR573]